VSDEKTESPHELTPKRDAKINPSVARWLGWGFVGFVMLETVWGLSDSIFRTAGQANPVVIVSMILFGLLPLAFAVLAALVITRQPGNVLGWLMTLPALAGIISTVSEAYFQKVNAPVPTLPLLLMVWLDTIAWTLFVFPTLLIIVLFPTGRPPSRRWNWVVVYAVGMWIFFDVIAGLSQTFSPLSATWEVANPIGFISSTFFDKVFVLPWTIALVLLTLLSVAALFVRYRRGTSVERAQLKWILYASSIFGLVYILNAPFGDLNANTPIALLLNFLFSLTALMIPVAIGVAILRYRLWDIDFVINRSLVYGGLTGLLAAVFGGSLFLVSRFIQGQSFIIAFGITAVLAGGLFNPARRRIQRFVDHRFYNIEIDYQATPPAVPPAVSKASFGAYQNLEPLGRGGMGEVYKARHVTSGQEVALKLLPSSLVDNHEFRERFEREGRLAARLSHPNIVRVFKVGETSNTPYIIMEYLGGEDLSALLRARGALSLEQALTILSGIASALDYAHEQGMIHRDIKPSNIMVDGTRVVLMDFGIAKLVDGNTALTQTGGVLGTFDYIAPEQIQAAPDIDGRADLYALAVMTYQMLAGELPFKHNNPGALLLAHLTQPPPDLCEIQPAISAAACVALQRAMSKNPSDRFVTAMDFVEALNS